MHSPEIYKYTTEHNGGLSVSILVLIVGKLLLVQLSGISPSSLVSSEGRAVPSLQGGVIVASTASCVRLPRCRRRSLDVLVPSRTSTTTSLLATSSSTIATSSSSSSKVSSRGGRVGLPVGGHLVVEGVEGLSQGAVHVEPPVADEVLLVEEGAVGTQERVLGSSAGAIVGADVERLALRLWIRVVTTICLPVAEEGGVRHSGEDRVIFPRNPRDGLLKGSDIITATTRGRVLATSTATRSTTKRTATPGATSEAATSPRTATEAVAATRYVLALAQDPREQAGGEC